MNARIAGVNVSDDRAYFVLTVGDICKQAIADYHFDVEFSRQGDVEIIDGYVGEGYGLSKAEELDLICEVARTERTEGFSWIRFIPARLSSAYFPKRTKSEQSLIRHSILVRHWRILLFVVRPRGFSYGAILHDEVSYKE